ncbi:MAG: nitrilase-related carbon-nitrogen hydrolase, partial [Sphingomonas sp.]
MADTHDFYSIHRQGMIRAGVCTPVATAGDPATNAASTIALAEAGHAEGADLLVFPELNVTSYAIDDLHMQDAILAATEAGIANIVEASRMLKPVLVVGAAVRRNGRVYNCGVAIARGRILGVVPKSFLPNYREYYEKRWFASGSGLAGLDIQLAGQTAPFGTDLVFAAADLADFIFHIEICEDYWAPTPPSTAGALAGALVLCNLSASNIVVGKARERALLSASQSVRTASAYLYSASGPGESTTDLAWDGQGEIYELGELLATSQRFDLSTETVYADLDLERLRLERMRTGTFNDAAAAAGHPETRFRRIAFDHQSKFEDVGFRRKLRRFPFVP